MGGGQSPFTWDYWKDNWKSYVAAGVMGAAGGVLGPLLSRFGVVLTGAISGLSLAALDQGLDMLLSSEFASTAFARRDTTPLLGESMTVEGFLRDRGIPGRLWGDPGYWSYLAQTVRVHMG